jgi:hypothetical protein
VNGTNTKLSSARGWRKTPAIRLGAAGMKKKEKAWRQLAHQIEAHETVQSDPTSGLSERSTVVGRLFLVRGPDG